MAAPQPEMGVLDLRDFDFSTGERIELNGQWRLKGSFHVNAGFIQVPGLWVNQPASGLELPDQGLQTYQLTVLLPPDPPALGLQFYDVYAAWRLRVSGKILAQTGTVGVSSQSTKHQFSRKLVSLLNPSGSLEIELEVANYSSLPGGIVQPIILGGLSALQNKKNQVFYLDILIIGAWCILALYHLTFFIYRPQERYLVNFALLCLAMGLFQTTTGSKIIHLFWQQLSLEVEVKVIWASLIVVLLNLTFFLAQLYPKQIGPKLKKALLISLIFFAAGIFSTDQLTQRLFIVGFQWFGFSALALAAKRLFTALRAKEPKAKLLFGSLIFFCVSALRDILVIQGIYPSTWYMLSFAFFLLVLVQAVILADRLSMAHTHAELLESSLSDYHDQLSAWETTKASSKATDTRELSILLMQKSLLVWESETGQTKVDLAEQSGLWTVAIDGGKFRTRTLDKYLDLKKLPQRPRWKDVILTAKFVLDQPQLSAESKNLLACALSDFKQKLVNQS